MYLENKVARIAWVDVAKGIGILLVILGHTVSEVGTLAEQMIRALIFSLHMPLFFILSALTYQFSIDITEFVFKLKKSFKHLIIPALILYGIRILVAISTDYSSIEWKKFLISKMDILFWSSGSAVHLATQNIPAFGIMWFCVVLFFSRELYDFLHLKVSKKVLIFYCVVGTLLGIYISYWQWLPLSMDLSFAVLLFLYFGYYLKNIDMNKYCLKCGGICFVLWIISLFLTIYIEHDYLELATRRYPLFPLSYFTAMVGTMFVAYLSVGILKYEKLAVLLIYIGKNSLWLYCVHAMDYTYIFVWDITHNNFINSAIRIVADIFLCVLVLKIKEILAEKSLVITQYTAGQN